jgi:Ca2+-binding EF-hand superfamily protein
LGLTQEEIDRAREVFASFDTDKSDTIDVWELKGALQKLGQNPSDDEVFALLSELDESRDSSLDFGEFLRLLGVQKKETSKETEDDEIFEAYLSLGGNLERTAFIDKQAVVDVVRKFGLTVDIDKIWDDIDTNRDKKVDYREFAYLLSSQYK